MVSGRVNRELGARGNTHASGDVIGQPGNAARNTANPVKAG
jgi:hypothetical protein